MPAEAFLVKATATIRLEGKAKIVDIDGKTVRELDLASLGEVVVKVDSVNTYWPDSERGIGFHIKDVWETAEEVKILRVKQK